MDLAVAGIDPSLASLAYDQPPTAHWTFFEDDRLAQAVRSHTTSSGMSWELVAAQVGTGKSGMQCEARWRELGFTDFEGQQAQVGTGGQGQDGVQEDLQVHSGPSFGHVTDEQARVLLMESLGYQDDIPVDSSDSDPHHHLNIGSSSGFDLSISPSSGLHRLPPLPHLPTLLAAAETASERLSIMHTTASPSMPVGQASTSEEPPEDISKRHWRPEEDTKLLSLVDTHGPRNWGRLAKTLGTGRTGPSCCARWCRLAGDDGTKKRRTDSSADARPKEAIPETHKSAYASIAKGKRQKWAKWSSEEDTQLAALVKEHGSLNWIFIASLMPSDPATGSQRSHDSCQARWNHYLCKKEEYQDWAEEAGVRSPSEGAGDEPSSRKMSKEDAEKARARARANAASSRWMPNDDDQLIRLKEENPTKSWAWLGDQLEPKRSAGSCRARWAQQITKNDEQKKERKARKDGAHNESIVAAAATLVAKNQRQASRQSKGKEVEQQDAQEPSAASSEASGSPSAVTKPAAPLVVAEAAEGGEAATKAVEKAVEEEVIEEEMTDAEVSGVRTRARRGKATSAAPPPTKAKKVTRRAQVWTPAEEQHLRDLVAEHGTKDWATTAGSLGTGRTPASVAARWHRLQSSSQEQPAQSASTSPAPDPTAIQSEAQYDPALEQSLLEAIATSVSASPHPLLPSTSTSTSAAASPLPDIHLPEDLAMSLSASPFDPQAFFGEGQVEQTPEEAQRELQMLLEGLMPGLAAEGQEMGGNSGEADGQKEGEAAVEGEREKGSPKRALVGNPAPSPRTSKRTRRS